MFVVKCNKNEADFVRSEDNELDICTNNLSFRLLKGFRDNIWNCNMNSRLNWTWIVKVAVSKNKHFAQKEDVVNWIMHWINHIWSVQSPEKGKLEDRVYYLE
jgi:hypothetical protein